MVVVCVRDDRFHKMRCCTGLQEKGTGLVILTMVIDTRRWSADLAGLCTKQANRDCVSQLQANATKRVNFLH